MLPVSRPSLPPLPDFERLLEDIWSTHMLSNFGKYARRFEGVAQEYLANPWVRCVVNGDIGLVLSLAALEIPEGSECLVQSFTFNSTVNAVLWNRLRPVFVDIDPKTFNVDVRDLERRIGPHTRAVVVTHIFGSPLDLDRVLELARGRGIPVVVDAAHGYGAAYRGIRIGDPRLGDYQVFSLSGTKQVTSAEGGLVAAASEELASRIEFRRAYGFQNDYVSRVLGLNGKLSEIHAALACLTAGDVERVVEARITKAARYRERLSRVAGLEFQQHLAGCRSAYKDFVILCPDRRDALADALEREGIQTKKYFRPLHGMPAFEAFRSAGDDLGDTSVVAERILCLPMFNDLTDAEIDRVCERVAGFYGRA
jgi:dTDP-4-amino-4,6-dideoxygalactose transaminase